MDSDNDVKCVLCEMSVENKVTGALSIKEEVTAHQNCLLFSSGLFCRDSPQLDDLFGFSAEDVLSEKQRGRKLSCKKCNKKGATVGCENGRCQKSYHYPCAIQAGAYIVEDKENGRFVIYCLRCKKSKLGLSDDDSNSSNVSTHNPKRKLDFSDCQKEKKLQKRLIIESDSDTDVTNSEEIAIFAPLESDLDENANSASKEQSNREHAPIAPGTSSGMQSNDDNVMGGKTLQMENQDKAENGGASVVPLAPDISIDSSNFWRDCASAGCTQVIFSNFIREMTDVFTRITSGEASKKDCDMAFNVIVASGKFEELVAKQQNDIQKKLTNLQQAAAALELVSAKMKMNNSSAHL